MLDGAALRDRPFDMVEVAIHLGPRRHPLIAEILRQLDASLAYLDAASCGGLLSVAWLTFESVAESYTFITLIDDEGRRAHATGETEVGRLCALSKCLRGLVAFVEPRAEVIVTDAHHVCGKCGVEIFVCVESVCHLRRTAYPHEALGKRGELYAGEVHRTEDPACAGDVAFSRACVAGLCLSQAFVG